MSLRAFTNLCAFASLVCNHKPPPGGVPSEKIIGGPNSLLEQTHVTLLQDFARLRVFTSLHVFASLPAYTSSITAEMSLQ